MQPMIVPWLLALLGRAGLLESAKRERGDGACHSKKKRGEMVHAIQKKKKERGDGVHSYLCLQ